MQNCLRCNKPSDASVNANGVPFDGKYETVCLECADDIDYKAAEKDYHAGLDVFFTFFCHYPADDEKVQRQLRSRRGLKKMGEIDDRRKKKNTQSG